MAKKIRVKEDKDTRMFNHMIRREIKEIRADFGNIKNRIPVCDPLFEKILYHILVVSLAFRDTYNDYFEVFDSFIERATRMLEKKQRR